MSVREETAGDGSAPDPDRVSGRRRGAVRESFVTGTTAVVRLHGEIDISVCDETRDAVRDALSDLSVTRVVVDLTEVTFIDSTGVGTLLLAYKQCRTTERTLRVLPSPAVERVLRLMGIEVLLADEQPPR